MRGSKIIVSNNPRGRFIEGIISGTPKPGVVMQVVAATEPVEGRFTWQVFDQASDGRRSLIAVLLEDDNQGKGSDDAYVSGTRGRMYCPVAGEELNMRMLDVAGTGDDHAIGDRLMVDDSTGKLVVDSSGESVPFVCLETATDPTADALLWTMYTGH
jgi:hypothetical protein